MLRKTEPLPLALPEQIIASMRPQRNAAENAKKRVAKKAAPKASMRPQRNAAENTLARHVHPAGRRRFNEAAA